MMYKVILGLLCLAVSASAYGDQLKCALEMPLINKEWVDMRSECVKNMRDQIQREIDASFAYLAMGAYFSRDTVNRPGFADFFFHSAKEERQHGSKLIEYLSMRGELTDGVTDLIKVNPVAKQEWADGISALEDALALEINVTKSIRKLMQTCEKGYNDYHLVDWLTAEYLDEQHKGQRELAGKISTLKKMMKTHGALGEFLFDKQNF